MGKVLQDRDYTRYVSFKGTSADNMLGILHTNNMVNIKAKYKVLEDLSVNQLVTTNQGIIQIKDYLLSLKEGPNHLFLSTE